MLHVHQNMLPLRVSSCILNTIIIIELYESGPLQIMSVRVPEHYLHARMHAGCALKHLIEVFMCM